jgi:hypothetical protein
MRSAGRGMGLCCHHAQKVRAKRRARAERRMEACPVAGEGGERWLLSLNTAG